MGERHTDTEELSLPVESANPFFVSESRPLRLEFGAVSHPGRRRSENEDHYLIMKRTRAQEVVQSNLETALDDLPQDETYALIVADGIGGHEFGHLASQLAVKTAWELTGRAACWIMRLDQVDEQEVQRRIRAYADWMQRAFAEHSRPSFGRNKMGTTWTSAYVVGEQAIIAHVGDSRVYHLRQDEGTRPKLKQVTHDHTVEAYLLDEGVAAEKARPYRNVLTQAFGAGREDVVPEVAYLRLQPGDRLLLCSDGLSDVVSEDEIEQVTISMPPQAACERLLQLALDAGAPDNVTVLMAAMHSE